MLRRLLVLSSGALLAAGLVAVGSPGSASPYPAPPAAVGDVFCGTAIGSGALGFGLTPAGGSTLSGDKINFSGKLSNCRAKVKNHRNGTINGGVFTGSGFYSNSGGFVNSCTNFDGPDVVGTITVKITWSTSFGTIMNTTVTFTGNTATVTDNGSVDTMTLSGSSTTVGGSFSSPPMPASLVLTTDLPAPNVCPAGPTSSFQVTAGSFFA